MKDTINFEPLYIKYQPVLLRFASRYIPDRSVAESVVQDIFTKVWERPDVLDGVRSEANYLLTMCRNACIDQLRKDKVSTTLSQLSEGQQWLLEERLQALYEMDEFSPYDEDVFERLEASIEALPPRCREILKMYRFQHMTYQEIADELEISPRTVEAQLRIAMNKLRDALPPSILLLLLYL